jgi:Predicted nucleic acid-binding protein, contains PIN domain
MSRYMLDATFLIDHLRGVPEAVQRFLEMNESGDESIVTDVTVAEVWSGRRPGSEHEIEWFLRYIEYVHPGPEAARLAGTWRAEAREAGRTLGIPDVLIAATAFDQEAAVLTRNVRDFAHMPVRVETY